jgi:hypothetical protein
VLISRSTVAANIKNKKNKNCKKIPALKTQAAKI